MAVVFIAFYKSIVEASAGYNESPQVQFAEYSGIQLLPNDPYPYTQITNHPTGIELEDATVKVMSQCGEELGDVTDFFTIDDVFDDDKGFPQIQWSLRGVTTDFGQQLVYLKVTQTAGEIFYTSLFQLTDFESKFTTRYDYWDSSYDYKQSVRLVTWFRAWSNADTQNNYFEKSTGNTRSVTVERQLLAIMYMDFWSNDLWVKVVRMLQSRWLYRNLVRNTLFETPEIPEPVEDANFVTGEYKLTVVSGEPDFDPNYVEPVEPIVEDTIVFKATAFIKPNEVGDEQYRIRFSFPVMAGFEIIQFGFSSIGLNNETVTLNSALSNVVGGYVNVMSNYAGNGDVVGQAHLQSFTFRVTDGVDSLEYIYTTPTVIFTFTDISNGIEKEITATITEV